MAKAKDDHTPELLPLDDDANWMPLPEAIQLRGRQTGDIGLAVLDLEQNQAGGQVRSMRRHRDTGDREHVLSSDWKTYFISYIGASSVTVSRQPDIDRHKTDDYGNLVAEPVDGVFYVWKPDFDRIGPVIQPATAQRQEAHAPAAGAPPKFTADQQQWLREKYGSDLATTPRLAKHDGAVAHVKNLAKTQFRIEAGRNTLLNQVIRPVLAAKKSQ